METLEVSVSCPNSLREVIWAEMSFNGYESMLETENGFHAYLDEENFDQDFISYLKDKYSKKNDIEIKYDLIKKVNWNEEWEKNYDPVNIDNRILIRADFHPSVESYEYEIVINPKMSFGTGHHDTTHLMMKVMLEIDLQGKSILDVGCGTGVLSILAKLRGASEVIGLDIDGWAVENSIENAERNGCSGIEFLEKELNQLTRNRYDVILANINLNYHLETFSLYKDFLNPGGVLLMSGFFTENADLIKKEALSLKLSLISSYTLNQWSVLYFEA